MISRCFLNNVCRDICTFWPWFSSSPANSIYRELLAAFARGGSRKCGCRGMTGFWGRIPHPSAGTKPPLTQPSIPPGSVNEYQLRQVWFIPLADRGVQVKLWDPLRTRAIPERLRGVFTTRIYVYFYLYPARKLNTSSYFTVNFACNLAHKRLNISRSATLQTPVGMHPLLPAPLPWIRPYLSPRCIQPNSFRAVAVQNGIESPIPHTIHPVFHLSLILISLFSLHRPWHIARSIPAIDRPHSVSLRRIDQRPYNRTPSKSASAYTQVLKSIHNIYIHSPVAPKGSNKTGQKIYPTTCGTMFCRADVGRTVTVSGRWCVSADAFIRCAVSLLALKPYSLHLKHCC